MPDEKALEKPTKETQCEANTSNAIIETGGDFARNDAGKSGTKVPTALESTSSDRPAGESGEQESAAADPGLPWTASSATHSRTASLRKMAKSWFRGKPVKGPDGIMVAQNGWETFDLAPQHGEINYALFDDPPLDMSDQESLE